MAKLPSSAAALKCWRQIYQTYNLFRQCQDKVCEEHGLSVEQYSVLMALCRSGGSANITDIARLLIRSPDNIGAIADRMVKTGLVRKVRSRRDRRIVRVTITSKGNAAVEQAHAAVLKFVRQVFQPLSNEDKDTITQLLGTLKYGILKYSEPDLDIQQAKRADSATAARTARWLSRLCPGPGAKGQTVKKAARA